MTYMNNTFVSVQDGSEYYKLAQKFSKKFEAMYKKIDLSAGVQVNAHIKNTKIHASNWKSIC